MSEKHTHEELLDKLHTQISNYTLQGWRIVDKNEKRLECVLEKGQSFSHTIHILLTLFTCLWAIVWYLQYSKNKEQRMRISYDKSGNYLEEKIKV